MVSIRSVKAAVSVRSAFLTLASGSLLVFVVLLSRCSLETIEPPASVLTSEPSKEDP